MVASTPTQTEMFAADAHGEKAKTHSKQPSAAAPHSLWDEYHGVTHEFEHRATEKVAFGVMEKVATHAGTMATNSSLVVRASEQAVVPVVGFAKMRKWVEKTILRKAPPMPKPPPVLLDHVLSSQMFGLSLQAVHVAMPALGTYLIALMAHHDWHKAGHEAHEGRAPVATALFYLGALCDTFDALAHAAIAVILLVTSGAHDDHGHGHGHDDHHGHGGLDLHHIEHTLHEYSLIAALVAACAMMLGEAIIAKYYPHSGSHGHHEKSD